MRFEACPFSLFFFFFFWWVCICGGRNYTAGIDSLWFFSLTTWDQSGEITIDRVPPPFVCKILSHFISQRSTPHCECLIRALFKWEEHIYMEKLSLYGQSVETRRENASMKRQRAWLWREGGGLMLNLSFSFLPLLLIRGENTRFIEGERLLRR